MTFRQNEYPIFASRIWSARGRPFAGLRRTWTTAYATTWLVTFSAAALVIASGARLKTAIRHLLGLHLGAERGTPHIADALGLAAHNIPIAAWPLLLGVIGVHRHRLSSRVADVVVTGWIVLNTMPVGVAIGAYGAPLLAFLPHVPFEWAALAVGMSGWSIQRRQALRVPEGFALFGLIVMVLLCAATLETFAVPRR